MKLFKDKNEFDLYVKAWGSNSIYGTMDDVHTGQGIWAQEIQATVDLNILKSLFSNDDWVYITVDAIASKIAGQELRVMKQSINPETHEAVYEPAPAHTVSKILDQPNEYQTYYEFMYSLVCDFVLAGNAFCYQSESDGSLIHVPVEQVQLDMDNKNAFFYRIVQLNALTGLSLLDLTLGQDAFKELMRIPREKMCHVKSPNPSTAFWGLSAFIPGRKSVLFQRYSQEYLTGFYLKGAQPSLILSMTGMKNAASVDSANRMLRALEQSNQGRKNQRRHMVLPQGVEAQTLNMSLADQQLKDYIELNRETILNLLKVPKHELSLQTSASLGSEEYKTALKNFWAGPLKSRMRAIEHGLSKLLAPKLGEGYYLEFDLSDVGILQDDDNAKADLAIKLLETHTLNEVRSKIFAEPPLEGGDELPVNYRPYPAAPSSLALDKDLKEEDTQPDLEQESLVSPHLKLMQDLHEKASHHDWYHTHQNLLERSYSEVAPGFTSLVTDHLTAQIEAGIKALKTHKKGKSYYTKDDPPDEIDKARLRRIMKEVLAELNEPYINDAQPQLSQSFDLGYQAGMSVGFKLPDPDVLDALKVRREAQRAAFLQSTLEDRSGKISQTSFDKMWDIIERGAKEQKTINQIAAMLRDKIPEIGNRAQTIARTEILTATSLGQEAAMEDIKELVPDLKKVWINLKDNRVRGNPAAKYASNADHWTIYGEVVGVDELFSCGLKFPRDPSGEPDNVINCRCSMLTVTEDMLSELGLG